MKNRKSHNCKSGEIDMERRNYLPQVSVLTMILQHDERYNPLSRTPQIL